MKAIRYTPEQYAAMHKRLEPATKSAVTTQRTAPHTVSGKNKYRNIKTIVDGITFASRKEAKRYQELKLRERAEEIFNLKLQVSYSLNVNKIRICVYIADFVYHEKGIISAVVEDTKGHRTREYIIKRKLMKAIYGIEIKET